MVLALGDGTRLNVLFPAMSAAPAPETEAKPEKTAGHAAKKTVKSKTAGKADDAAHMETMKARLADLRSSGFNRLWQQGRIFEFSTPESLVDLDLGSPFFVLLDRIVVSADNRPRIVDAVETAYREAGEVVFEEVPRDEMCIRDRVDSMDRSPRPARSIQDPESPGSGRSPRCCQIPGNAGTRQRDC